MDNRPKDILIKGLSSVQTVTAVEGAVPQMALFLSTQYHLALWGRAQPYDNNNKKKHILGCIGTNLQVNGFLTFWTCHHLASAAEEPALFQWAAKWL